MILAAMQANKILIAASVSLSLFPATGQQIPGPSGSQVQLSEHRRLYHEYLAEHDPAKAIPELQAVVSLAPNDVEARGNLGVLLFFQGQFTAAIPQLHAAVELQPGLTKIQSLLGIAERRVGDDRAGRADLEAAFPHIEEEKLKMDVGRDLIDSYSAKGELDQAADVVAALLKLKPTDPNLLYTSYRIHNDLAVESLLALGLAAPGSGQLHQAMAHELQRDRDLPATIANLRQALALDPSLPGIHYELAEALHASDDQRLRTESIQQYKLAVETAPADPKAAARMGDIEVEQGNLTAAKDYYNRTLKLSPDYPDAQIGLANLLSEQGKAAEAAALLERVEVADATNSLAHYRLSVVYRKLNRPTDMKRELELYQHYKDQRESLQATYKKMRAAEPLPEPAK